MLLGALLRSFPVLLSAFPDRRPELHPAHMAHGFYGDLMLFSVLVCVPPTTILLAFLISAEHGHDISRRFSVITLRSFLCVVTVNSETNMCLKLDLCIPITSLCRYLH